jgi:hypothetical protein
MCPLNQVGAKRGQLGQIEGPSQLTGPSFRSRHGLPPCRIQEAHGLAEGHFNGDEISRQEVWHQLGIEGRPLPGVRLAPVYSAARAGSITGETDS